MEDPAEFMEDAVRQNLQRGTLEGAKWEENAPGSDWDMGARCLFNKQQLLQGSHAFLRHLVHAGQKDQPRAFPSRKSRKTLSRACPFIASG